MFGKGAIISIFITLTAVYVRNYKNPNKLKAPIVEISNGKLEGIISTSRDGRNFYEYLNIPYAKPPIDLLRFEPPEPVENWEGVRDASEYGPKCLQLDLFFNDIDGVEDCLQLNVHTPQQIAKGTLLPVLVWLHGGLYIFGSGTMYRPDYFMDNLENPIVLVTINYRLGSFGFLNTGDGQIRGNMGLKDQVLALKWVQENIAAFNGDPKRVTIFGESAGASSAHLLQLSPMAKGLFHKIISQSGNSLMPWVLHPTPAIQSKRFAEKLNCTTSDAKLMVSCLKSLSAQEVINGHSETMDPLRETISVFVPTIELDIPDGKTFLSESPEKLLNSGNYEKVPLISGVVSQEGLINAAVIYRNETLTNLLKSDWDKWVPRLLYLPDSTSPKVLQKIKDLYFIEDGCFHFEKITSFHEFENLTNMFSDRFWNVDFSKGIKSQIRHSTPTKSPIYLYYYTYQSQFSLTDIVLALKGDLFHPVAEVLSSKIKTWFATTFLGEKIPRFGISHGDEIAMQFFIPLPLMPIVPPNHVDYKFSKEMIKLWTNFAAASSEDFTLEFMGQEWHPQKANETNLKYLQLDATPSMITAPFEERVEFWNSILKNSEDF